MKRFALVLLVPLFTYAQVSKSGTIKLNDYVNLTTGVIVTSSTPGRLVTYPCSTSAINRDFFINYIDYSTCICACPSGAVGSPRPFYRYKQALGTLNLSSPINLKDTVNWARIDTVRNDPYLPGCLLPYEIDRGPSSVFIVTTAGNKNVLITITPIINTVQCSDLVTPGNIYYWTQNRLSGYNVMWYLNNNASTDFRWVNLVGIKHGQGLANQPKQTEVTGQSELYTLLGQKVPSDRVGRNRGAAGCQSLYIIKTQGCIGVTFR